MVGLVREPKPARVGWWRQPGLGRPEATAGSSAAAAGARRARVRRWDAQQGRGEGLRPPGSVANAVTRSVSSPRGCGHDDGVAGGTECSGSVEMAARGRNRGVEEGG